MFTSSSFGNLCINGVLMQRVKKVMSDSPGLVDFPVGLVDEQRASQVFGGILVCGNF